MAETRQLKHPEFEIEGDDDEFLIRFRVPGSSSGPVEVVLDQVAVEQLVESLAPAAPSRARRAETRMAETAMPTWDVYAIDLARRLADHGASPTTIVVGILAYVVENEGVGVDEHERAMAKAWLDRLVDEEGNPKDDKGRNALVWAFEENTLSHHGSLTAILPEDDRVTLEMVVSRRAASLDRANLRAQLVPHAESYVDHLLDELYGEKPEA